MVDNVKKFEVGWTYTTRSVCDYDTVYSYTVLARTEKTILLQNNMDKQQVRRKIRVYGDKEIVLPDGSYSMCPVLSVD